LQNIDKSDVQDFKRLAKVMLAASERGIEVMLERGEIEEVV